MQKETHHSQMSFHENSFQTIEQYSKSLPSLNLEGFQLSNGDFNGQSNTLSTSEFQISSRTAEVKHTQHGILDDGYIGFLFPIKDLTYLQNGRLIKNDSQIVAYENLEFQTIYPKNHAHFAILLSTSALNNYISDDETVSFLKNCECIQNTSVCPAQKLKLTQSLHSIHTTLQLLLKGNGSQLACKDCCDSLFYALNDYQNYHSHSTSSKPKKLQHREKLLQRVLEYIYSANIKELTISTLIKDVHTSSRSLQYCFSELLNTTPKNFLIKLRLNHIRKELLLSSADETKITHVANSFGVTNIGRFKKDYEIFFNETPKETLQIN